MNPRRITCRSSTRAPGQITSYTARLKGIAGDWFWDVEAHGLDLGGVPKCGKAKFRAITGSHEEMSQNVADLWANVMTQLPK